MTHVFALGEGSGEGLSERWTTYTFSVGEGLGEGCIAHTFALAPKISPSSDETPTSTFSTALLSRSQTWVLISIPLSGGNLERL